MARSLPPAWDVRYTPAMSDTPSRETAVRLTKTAQRAGCAAKHPPGYLLPLLQGLPAVTDPRVLVGSNTADDAAVIRFHEDRALVFTTDFFTPIVDDPFEFGQVAAANALSDVYAMGGKPVAALGIVGFPDQTLPVEVLAEILRGGALKAKEAGIDVVGGHTIKTDEPIYGLAVVGEVHPDRVMSNDGARTGDRLVLSKPLGIGVIATAAKNDQDELGAMPEAIAVMSALNQSACEAMLEVGAHACTDITGFGLLGHLRNVCAASGVSARVDASAVPVLAAARTYVERGIAPGGTHANWRFLNEWTAWGEGVTKPEQLLLCDAQTSGGLLIAVAPERAEALIAALRARGTAAAAVVGEIVAGPAGKMIVERGGS
jgi:selenide,water dikinase